MKALITNNVKDQRKLLCRRLQQNRRVIERVLVNGETKFPRSLTMRLITQNKVAVGISISRIFSVGFSFLSFMKRKLERNSRVEHIKGR